MAVDTIGIKRFLQRTRTLAEIKAISEKAFSAVLNGEDMIAITSSGFDGGNGAGQLVVSASQIGTICEEIIADAEGDSATRRCIFVRADMTYSGEATL